MTSLRLSALCLLTAGIYLAVVGSEMCDDGWVYYLDTATCLQVVPNRAFRPEYRKYEDLSQCHDRKGGEFRNVSGNIVKFTEAMEPYLRDYLQSLSVPAALVELSIVWVSWPDDAFHRVMKYSRQRDTYKQLTYFVPGKLIPFSRSRLHDEVVICQVPAGDLEPPACPRDLQLVSVSDSTATLSWSPGQLGRKVDVNINVQICDAMAFPCVDFTNRTFSDVSLFQSRNYTVTGLQPKTRHKLDIQIILDYNKNTKDCNVTLALTTKEISAVAPVTLPRKEKGQELSGAVVGLLTALIICLLICFVLSFLLFRNSRQSKDKNSDAEKTDAKGEESKYIVNLQENLQDHNNPEISANMYVNSQQLPQTYDKVTDQEDNNVYEM
ncbi:unnamed protein product [Candidula unifasciata]|uniref:Fibronectin type-III domain-containing protein n=1 Tax=Candidula unifasciata TaxID=100452 RepID=A0A8S3ZQS7_9EUPU|nr:unnamed protein product [Candidula unifasciata]